MKKQDIRQSFRRITAMVMICAMQTAAIAQTQDLSRQMEQMFGNTALSNATGPGVYRSQTQNIYMGGEFTMRMPSRTYQLYSYSLPRITADCGGVDVYLGSFSHISSDQLRQMLEQVAAQYGALLFKAALKAINPMIESVIGDLQKTLETFSAAQGNTCKLAQMAVDSTLGGNSNAASQKGCEEMAMYMYGEDASAARRRCRTGTAPTNAAAQSSADPEARKMAKQNLNLVIAALQGTSLSRLEKELFMNIAGTVVVMAASANGDVPTNPVMYDPTVDSLNTLLYGNAPGTSADTVTIRNWRRCNDDACLAPTTADQEVVPFPALIRSRLYAIRDAVINRQALTAEQIGFINSSSVPIYRLISMASTKDSSASNSDLVNALIERYSKVIAYDYAYAFLRNSLKDVRLYLNMSDVRDKATEAQVDKMIRAIEQMLVGIQTEHAKASAYIRDMRAIVDDLRSIERDMQLSLPANLRSMKSVGALLPRS